jgi:ABC-type antimicrobial peptide transport system permease subunit
MDRGDLTLWEMTQAQLIVSLLLIAITVNLAVLVYARTAMRQGEIAVRSALGASRRRIVSQLFVEALLFSTLGAGLGLGRAHLYLRQIQSLFDSYVAFWVDYGLQPRATIYAAAVADRPSHRALPRLRCHPDIGSGLATSGEAAILLGLVAALMLSAGLMATVDPARRGLRIHPMEALKEE